MKIFTNWLRGQPEPTPEQPAFNSDSPAPSRDATGSTPDASAEPSDGPSIGQNRKILIVDDNKVVLKAFEMKLKTLGFQVLTATDGTTAVNTAREEKPDIVVLDINFPPDVGSTGLQWDGFNIMEWMSRFKEAAGIPVIIITSGDAAKFKARAIAAGAVAFFQKPIDHEEFIVTIRRTLGQNKSSNPAAA